MANDKKLYLDQAGLDRLWAAIEQKFIDTTELTAALAAIDLDIEPLSNADIDAITGYVAPVEENNNDEP